jgi:glucose-6-phosphate dehydrogenase assembly protein OpcA
MSEIYSIAPAEIEPKLSQIWTSLETKGVARASLFNLLIYVEEGHRLAYVEKIIHKIVETFPARIFLIVVKKRPDEQEITAEVSILPSSKGEFDVACDFIRLSIAQNAKDRIPLLLLPHILPDLPIYLLWAEELRQEQLPLEQALQRVIFDSECATSLSHFATQALSMYETKQLDIADLNWARTETLRDLFLIAFFPQERREQLERMISITITYNAKETSFFTHTKVQSIFLQAWLASQLGWEWKELTHKGNAVIFSYTKEKTAITCTLLPESFTNLPPGLILDVEMGTTKNEHFLLQRDRKEISRLTFYPSDNFSCQLPSYFTFSRAESGHSLVKEITHRETSKHFLKVLQLLKRYEHVIL